MTQLTHAERDARDAAYMAELRALTHPDQHERGRLMRENLVRFYPRFAAMFASLPELREAGSAGLVSSMSERAPGITL